MKDILKEMHAQSSEFIELRRDIHRHPELGFQELRTSELVAQRLRNWGYEVTTGMGATGVVGQLRRGNGSRRLGLRADMDGLPVQEATGLPYASCRAGVMHACGHDGHTATLLAAAKYLASRGDFNGTLNLIFQPAEEGLGGAKRMMEDGLFDRFPCDAIFALHNMPGFPVGQFLFRAGPAMASSENITIGLEGTGGHGAMPHVAVDPVVAGASIVMGLQTIVSRNVPPLEMAVITVGSFQAGQTNNVIPQSATLRLSVRALDRKVHELLKQRIRELVELQAASYGVRAQVGFEGGYPVLVNTEAETELARDVALELVGADRVVPQTAALSGSEDFAFMLEKVPGSYFFIGNGDEATGGAAACMVHNPGYDFNDQILAAGAAYWVSLAERYLQ
ncbi:M20 aminoacylase family protein [Noviherbaspirillum saxi]|uniref:Amidohydrolase n=1 Tax=Noviherbaspirillum saxi TaxID=2320863 RepID=A0A3A3G3A4_9BURK|nr:M20 aminoacylase family protein [Noviherbaspirillum saxi]RJF95896.1 amidohydrolase [Noviherbaspirillum saxi]